MDNQSGLYVAFLLKTVTKVLVLTCPHVRYKCVCYIKMATFSRENYLKAIIFPPIIDRSQWGMLKVAHIPRTETQVKKIVSDIPPHTNQNIGIG